MILDRQSSRAERTKRSAYAFKFGLREGKRGPSFLAAVATAMNVDLVSATSIALGVSERIVAHRERMAKLPELDVKSICGVTEQDLARGAQVDRPASRCSAGASSGRRRSPTERCTCDALGRSSIAPTVSAVAP
jgi:hypothetical protein